MSGPLIIWLPDELSAPWPWFLTALDFGVAETDAQKLLLAPKAGKEVVAILPGQWTRIFDIDLPKMRAQDRLSAAGYSLEDKLGSGLKDQHIVLGSSDDLRAAVISKSKLDSVTKNLSKMGLRLSAAYTDYDVITPDGGVFDLGERIIVAGRDGFALDSELYNSLPDQIAPREANIISLSEGLNISGGLNLLQGKFAQSRFDVTGLLSLSRAAGLLAVIGLAGLGWMGAQARAVSLQAADLRVQTQKVYETATGQSAPSNPALAVTRARRANGDVQADFLSLSAVLFDAVSRTDGVVVESVQYDNAQARLSVRFVYPSFESGEQLEAQISRSGGVLQAGGVREQGGRKIGDAVITMRSGS